MYSTRTVLNSTLYPRTVQKSHACSTGIALAPSLLLHPALLSLLLSMPADPEPVLTILLQVTRISCNPHSLHWKGGCSLQAAASGIFTVTVATTNFKCCSERRILNAQERQFCRPERRFCRSERQCCSLECSSERRFCYRRCCPAAQKDDSQMMLPCRIKRRFCRS
jgi:hypothetical protein